MICSGARVEAFEVVEQPAPGFLGAVAVLAIVEKVHVATCVTIG